MMLDWGFEPNLSHLGSFPPPLSQGNLYLIHFFLYFGFGPFAAHGNVLATNSEAASLFQRGFWGNVLL